MKLVLIFSLVLFGIYKDKLEFKMVKDYVRLIIGGIIGFCVVVKYLNS